MSVAVYLVDAFTKEVGKGNRAGVVLDADSLSTEDMQAIAKQVNVSETAFVLHTSDNSHDLWVRYFTPTHEVPICGHATIATHYLRAMLFQLPSSRILCKTGAGILPVDICKHDDDYSIVMTQGKVELFPAVSSEIQSAIVKALGITLDDLDPTLPIQVVSTGHSKFMIPLRYKSVLDSLNPDMESLKILSASASCNGYFCFTLDTGSSDYLICGRMFAPAIGILEDPVTGNANGPAGFYLLSHGKLPITTDPISYLALQGEAIGKTGSMEVIVYPNEDPVKVQIKGTAVIAKRPDYEKIPIPQD